MKRRTILVCTFFLFAGCAPQARLDQIEFGMTPTEIEKLGSGVTLYPVSNISTENITVYRAWFDRMPYRLTFDTNGLKSVDIDEQAAGYPSPQKEITAGERFLGALVGAAAGFSKGVTGDLDQQMEEDRRRQEQRRRELKETDFWDGWRQQVDDDMRREFQRQQWENKKDWKKF